MARHPRVSPTASTLSAAVYSNLVQKAAARTERTFALQVGDTWRDPPECARAEAQRTSDHPHLHAYAPVQGVPALLDAIQERLRSRHGEDVDREAVQVMLGATAGLAVVVDALIDPGDEVIVLAPFWPLIRGIIASRGATPVQVPFFDRLGASGFDPEAAVARAVTPRTAAIYVNSPNNPSGRVLPPDVVAALARIARRHDLWVLSDDVYEDLAYVDPGRPVWTHADLRGRTIVTHSFSKSYALAGARVGYAHGPADAMKAVRGVQTFITYSAPTPFQFAAARVLVEGEEWLRETRAIYADAGRRAATALGLPLPKPARSSSSMRRPSSGRARGSTASSSAASMPVSSSRPARLRGGTTRRSCGSASPPCHRTTSASQWQRFAG